MWACTILLIGGSLLLFEHGCRKLVRADARIVQFGLQCEGLVAASAPQFLPPIAATPPAAGQSQSGKTVASSLHPVTAAVKALTSIRKHSDSTRKRGVNSRKKAAQFRKASTPPRDRFAAIRSNAVPGIVSTPDKNVASNPRAVASGFPLPTPATKATDSAVVTMTSARSLERRRLPDRLSQSLSGIEYLTTLIGYNPRSGVYYAWWTPQKKNEKISHFKHLFGSKDLKLGLYFQGKRNVPWYWGYQMIRIEKDSVGDDWVILTRFNLTGLFIYEMIPSLLAGVFLFGLLFSVLIWITRTQEQRLEQGLTGLETSLQDVFMGHYDTLFEAREFSLTQRIANIMNQMLYFFKQDMEKRESRHQRDALTGLYTRGYLMNMLEKEIGRTKRYQRPLSFVMCDIDHFKKFNDTYGHQMGDRVLTRTAEILKENTRETDIVGRYGGEEIGVILSETHLKDAMMVAEKLRRMVESAKLTYKNQTVQITLSLGVTSFLGEEKDTVHGIIERADKALYEAKQAGRNQVRRRI